MLPGRYLWAKLPLLPIEFPLEFQAPIVNALVVEFCSTPFKYTFATLPLIVQPMLYQEPVEVIDPPVNEKLLTSAVSVPYNHTVLLINPNQLSAPLASVP